MHVLILEGQNGMANNMADLLLERGCLVVVAEGNLTNRDIELSSLFDVIVIFEAMPETDAVAQCRKLRANRCVATPILVITNRTLFADKLACLEAGADDYLVHPVTDVEIMLRLRLLLRQNPGVLRTLYAGTLLEH